MFCDLYELSEQGEIDASASYSQYWGELPLHI